MYEKNKPFHQDPHLQKTMSHFLKQASAFVETGTRRGVSLKYVKDNFPKLACYSCEPVIESYEISKNKFKEHTLIYLYNTDSVVFLEKIKHIFQSNKHYVCWLDAHGPDFKWPLREEVSFFSKLNSVSIFIDDFKVPDRPHFKFNTREGQECSSDYIKDCIENEYKIYYPNYTGFKRGWCLIQIGDLAVDFDFIKRG